MKTLILMWNPAISSIDMRAFKDFFAEPVGTDFNWSVWDWKQAHAGDRFFMVRVGEEGKGGKGNGIVMSGYLTSEPYRGRDWSGKGREVYYMDLQPDYLFDTEKVRTLTDEFLMESFPQFDWTGGHSGRVLDTETAALLEECWEKVLIGNEEILANGRRWRTVLDVFRKYPVVELWRAHWQNCVDMVDAEFYGGGLDVMAYSLNFVQGDWDLLLDKPEGEYSTSVDNYSIEITSLKKALGVETDREVAKILRREYSGRDGMKRLLEFAKGAGCRIDECNILID